MKNALEKQKEQIKNEAQNLLNELEEETEVNNDWDKEKLIKMGLPRVRRKI